MDRHRAGWFFRLPVPSRLRLRFSFLRYSPEENLNRLLLDAQKQLADARRLTAAAVAREKHLLQELDDRQRRATRHESDAMEALRRNDEEAARRETRHWSREREYARSLEDDLAQRRDAVEALRHDLRRLQERIADAERRKALMLPRLRDPDTRKLVARTLRDLSGVPAPEVFGLLEELTRPVPGRNPEAEVRALTDPTEEEMLEDLRARIAGEKRT
ncbi:MAG: hypothetical protein EA427_04025 [Spirochaetaceae bacterium]|nr:MAG: hypothetical protein EA427_04025 [Spirochaetaceae bacterium]